MSKFVFEKKKLIERCKTALIIVLLISAALLLNTSGYITLIPARKTQENASGGQTNQGAVESAQMSVTVFPLGMAISASEGKSCAIYYDREQLAPAFESFAAPLAEALGSAGSAREITRSEWQDRLLGAGVYFDFYGDQPLSLLSALLGSTAGEAGGFSARSLLLSCTENGVELCLESAADGLYYSFSTGVSASAVLSRAESYGTDGSYFAFTSGDFPGVDPNTVILSTQEKMRSALSENSAGAVEMESLMAELGMNSYVIRPYTEADGTRVFVESGKTLRVGADGKISFKAGARERADTTLIDSVIFASALVQRVLGPCCGDAQLCFAGVSGDSGAYTVRFDYMINGIAVELPEQDAAASVTVSGGEAVKLEFVPRRYTLTQETYPLLPMEQAAAIAAASSGGRISLVYMDGGSSASCVWVTD